MNPIRFISVCSGIEAASVAFGPLGWEPILFAEIESFPNAVLMERYPHVPNIGDFTKLDVASINGGVDVLCAGTPCQSFSIAGDRRSMSDARGNLTLAFVDLAHELVRRCGLRNALWENVPGVLNTPDNAFGCFLGGLVGSDGPLPCDRRWPNAGMVAGPLGRAAWRVFDAQYFGLAQRRARVFVVADFGNGADPAAVLFERKSVRGDPAPRRQTRKNVAPTLSARTKGGGGLGTDFTCSGGLVAHTLTAHGRRQDFESETLIAHALRSEGFDASEDGTGRGTPIVVVDMQGGKGGGGFASDISPTLGADDQAHAIAFTANDYGADAKTELSPTLRAGGAYGANDGVMPAMRGHEGGAQFEGPHDTANIRAASGGSSRSYVADQYAVRRLTPLECERLQGFTDNYTLVEHRKKPATDGPRYKALGNSWAVNCVHWIGSRMDWELRLSRRLPIAAE